MAKNKKKPARQVAALPYREVDGRIEVLLLTSRGTKRMVLPKGWPMRRMSNAKAAAVEAREEAGVVGKVSPKPFGSFRYWKRLSKTFILVEVELYPLSVDRMLEDYKEKGERQLRWVDPENASLSVDEPELAILLERFAIEWRSRAIPVTVDHPQETSQDSRVEDDALTFR